MRILRPINNNIVSAYDDGGREVVVIGKGIGYKAREGAEIPPEKIDKVFVMSSQNNMDRLKELFASLPTEYIEITDEILTYAKRHLGKRLNEAAYFTLADHISFAVTRRKQGMEFQSILLTEVKRFHAEEFHIGLYALRLMKEKLDVDMPEDEAASIALHILNAEYDISISDAFHATKLIDQIIDMVTKETGYTIDASDYYFERFITHLRYLTQRIIRSEPLPESEDDGFFEMLAAQYPKEMSCAKTIAAMVLDTHRFVLQNEEIGSLTVHIKRIGLQKS
jgi:beta-glucoside operon transcriptional antiterminator